MQVLCPVWSLPPGSRAIWEAHSPDGRRSIRGKQPESLCLYLEEKLSEELSESQCTTTTRTTTLYGVEPPSFFLSSLPSLLLSFFPHLFLPSFRPSLSSYPFAPFPPSLFPSFLPPTLLSSLPHFPFFPAYLFLRSSLPYVG